MLDNIRYGNVYKVLTRLRECYDIDLTYKDGLYFEIVIENCRIEESQKAIILKEFLSYYKTSRHIDTSLRNYESR